MEVSPAQKIGRRYLRSVPTVSDAEREEPLSDGELIEAIVAGDARVAGRLYDRLYHSVDQTLYRVLGRREADHEDLVQSSFEQIVKTLARQRFAGACSLKTWASSVATHVGLNALRSRQRERRVFDKGRDVPESSPTHQDPERDAGARRELELLRRELASMKPERAQTLLLHDVMGHDLAEIAALHGVSIAAAQSRLVRGRKELFRRLGRQPGGKA